MIQTLGAEELARQLRDPDGATGLAVADALSALNREGSALVLAALRLSPDARVLEVGCGLGDIAPAVVAAAPGIHYTGLDRSPTMVTGARERHIELLASGRADIQLGEVEQMPFDAGSFTRLCSVGVIHFWPDPARAIGEMARVCRPGALIAMAGLGPRRAPPFARAEYGFISARRRHGASCGAPLVSWTWRCIASTSPTGPRAS